MELLTANQASFSTVRPSCITEENVPKKDLYRKSFYIMKVIYNSEIYWLLAIKSKKCTTIFIYGEV